MFCPLSIIYPLIKNKTQTHFCNLVDYVSHSLTNSVTLFHFFFLSNICFLALYHPNSSSTLSVTNLEVSIIKPNHFLLDIWSLNSSRWENSGCILYLILFYCISIVNNHSKLMRKWHLYNEKIYIRWIERYLRGILISILVLWFIRWMIHCWYLFFIFF